jgi:NAD(P)-dependent dehydrogenase (short-subunit alcohol dehydrogenase family)
MAFHSESTALEVIAGHDLAGQTALITGASGGIGLETARALVSAGAHVVLANRSAEKSEAALADLSAFAGGGPGSAEIIPLDLTKLSSVRECAKMFLDRHDRLDILVNNAGVMATPFERTTDGFELQLGVNHLGHFLLTELLTPALLAAPAPRIVNVSSDAYAMGGIDFEDPNFHSREYSSWGAYSQSKSANLLFTVELQRRFGDRGLQALAIHPGVVRTDLMRYLSDADQAWLDGNVEKGGIAYKSAAQGAATSVAAILADRANLEGVLYFEDCQPKRKVKTHARDPEIAKRLWVLSEELVGSQAGR